MKRILVALLLVICGVSFFAPRVDADQKIVGASCVPTNKTIEEGRYQVWAGRVMFKEKATGNITLICPVSSSAKLAGIDRIMMSYLDGDGKGDQASIKAVLRGVLIREGRTAKTFDEFSVLSNEFASSTLNEATSVASKSIHNLDDAQYYYFVQVMLERKSSSVDVAFVGVMLIDTP